MARRVFGLFLLSAILPVGMLAVLSYRSVRNQFHERGRTRVQEASRVVGQRILERLGFFDADLAMVASNLLVGATGGDAIPAGSRSRATARYLGLTIQHGDGTTRSLLGRARELPDLGDDESLHLKSGASLLWTQGSSRLSPVLMARAIDPQDLARGVLWAELDPVYLSAGEDSAAVPDGVEICVLVDATRALFCTLPVTVRLLEQIGAARRQADDRQFEWSDQDTDYIASSWSFPLKSAYLSASWTVVLSETKATVLEPLGRFQVGFLLTIVLALWVVLFLSNVQIRRSLGPLRTLQEGTQRVARRDFSTPVKVESRDEFEDLAMSFNSMAHRLGRQFSALTAINELDRAVLSALDTERIIETVLWRTHDALGSDGVSLSLAAADGAGAPWTLIWVDRAGGEKVVQEIRPKPEELQELRDHPEYLLVDEGRNPSYLDVARFVERGMRFFVVLPIFLKRKLSGVIALGYKGSSALDEEDLVQARQLADQVAVALSNARLVEELDQFNWGALAALAQTVDAKSPWTAGHSERVTRLCLAIGHKMDLSSDELDVLHRGGLLHDIGKIAVPAAVLDKPGKLTDEEWQVMRDHVTVGARILTPIAAYADLIPIVLRHHERYDGSGYPDGLVGEDTPFLARLLAVPDVYDALNSDRPYRPAWPRPKVIEYLAQRSGTLFDPEVTKGFLAVIEDPAPEARYETFPLLPSVGS